jgi:hypothetical protein
MLLYIENINYIKNIQYYSNNCSNLDYIIYDNDMKRLKKKDIFKLYFEIISQIQPKFIDDEIDELLDKSYTLETPFEQICKKLNINKENKNEILYRNFIEMEDLDETIDYLYYRQLMGYRQMTDDINIDINNNNNN